MRNRNFEQRSGVVSEFHDSGQDQEKFASTHGIKLSSLRRWLSEERKLKAKGKMGSGYVEIDAGSFSALGSIACRVVVEKLAFEFGALPGPGWLGEFANTLCETAKRRK